MKRLKWLALIMVLTLALPLMPAGAQVAGDAAVASKGGGGWYIVQFEEPSLVAYATATVSRRNAMTVGGKLNVSAPASQTYVGQLKQQQAAFAKSLAVAIPGARVERGYQIVLNAVAVELPSDDLETIRTLWSMPGVERVSPQQIYTVEMDYSLPLINASALWSQLGGREGAGEGVKVAVIDTGIDPDHPMFDGTGWSYPSTGGPWPKGYCADHAGFCNGKIISARYYAPTFAVNVREVLTPQDIDGHGSHTGGTATGNVVTATYGTDVTQISGVAPGAWIMAYKGLFHNVAGTTASGSNIMLAGAIEDAVADGADVVNNSWGSDPIVFPANDPLVQAYEAAADAGIVIVFSIGNSGSGYNTAGTPSSPKFISVGATTTQRAYYNTLDVTAPTPVTSTLQGFPATEMSDIAPSAIPTTTIGPLPYLPTGRNGNLRTTTPEMLPGGLVVPTVTMGITQTAPYSTGWIAVIPRGVYSFAEKVAAARAQGAVAAVIYLPPGSTYGDDDWKGGFTVANEATYTVITGKVWGGGLVEWWKTNGDLARLQIGYPVSPYLTEVEDVIADFSSRGPQVNLSIEPDVMAPGVNILSADPTGAYAVHGGTSMAAPHVAGAAALLLQQHPTWTPAQVKSALMSTAYQGIMMFDEDLEELVAADVMAQGSGRIDLSKAGDPGLTFNKPSYSFGMVPQGSTESVLVTATDVSGMAETYDLSIQETFTDTGNVTVTVSPAMLDVAADGTATFTLTVEVGAGALLQDLEGNVVVSGTTHMTHIPYWLRVTPPALALGEVLLVDMDFSALPLAGDPWGFFFGDYLDYYTSTLQAVGVTYDVWDVVYYGSPTRDVLDLYDKVVVFTGDYFGIFPYNPGTGWNIYLYDLSDVADDIRNYLAAGGKMLVTGQDALGIDGLASYMRGAADDPLWDGTFAPVVVGVGTSNPFLQGMLLDLTPLGDGAGNQAWVDELDYRNYIDLDTEPLFKVTDLVTDVIEFGCVATRSSYEPTIERVKDPIGVAQEPVSWRVAFLGFGLEGVNDDAGYNTRAQLLGALFDWLDDEVGVAFGDASYFVPAPFGSATFMATMTSSLGGDAIYYRWDFGDGSDIDVTDDPTVSHQYLEMGTYWARVEVMDEFGHKAVSEPVKVTVGYHVFLPLVLSETASP